MSDEAPTLRSVAFLRAINVGGRRLKMADLLSALEHLGAGSTYLASGNVIFDSTAPIDRKAVEDAIEVAFGFVSEAFVRTAAQVTTIVESSPWDTTENLVEVSFLEDAPGFEAAAELENSVEDPEALRVIATEVFFRREGKAIDTVHKEAVTMRLLGMKTTRRGFATVSGIAERFLT